MHTIADKKLLMLRPQEIISAKSALRTSIDGYELKNLANSIAVSGIIEPLTVRKNSEGRYELIAGERRLRAARMAGLRRVPCIIHRADDVTSAFYSVVENTARCNLNFFEEAAAIERLISGFRLSRTETAVRLGISQSALYAKLHLLKLDEELRRRITVNNLTERHARELLKLPPEHRTDALDKIIAQDLNIRATEELIDSILYPAAAKTEIKETPPLREEIPAEPIRKSAIGDTRFFSNSLTKLVESMQNAGFEAGYKRYETDKYIEYRVRIPKQAVAEKYPQLRMC